MKVLVTGGTGFVGSNIVDAFLEQGWSVEVWDNLSTGTDLNLPSHPALQFETIDVTRHEEYPEPGEGYTEPDVVVHCATLQDRKAAQKAPADAIRSNVGGTANLSLRFTGSRFLFVSCLESLYSDGVLERVPISESTDANPSNVHGLSLVLAEVALLKTHGDWLSMRLSTLYGPRQNPLPGTIASILEAARTRDTLDIPGDGLELRDYLHVEDAAQAVVRAASLPEDTGLSTVLHVTRGHPYTVRDVVAVLHSTGHKPTVVWSGERDPLRYHRLMMAPPNRAAMLLGWEPRWDIPIYFRSEIAAWENQL